jgi:hypothetical protein
VNRVTTGAQPLATCAEKSLAIANIPRKRKSERKIDFALRTWKLPKPPFTLLFVLNICPPFCYSQDEAVKVCKNVIIGIFKTDVPIESFFHFYF